MPIRSRIRVRMLSCALAVLGVGNADRLSAMAQSPAIPHPYAVFELPSLGGDYSYGWTLDDIGNVVGTAYLEGNHDGHATLWVDGRSPFDLGTLGGSYSGARGINSNGWIVGRSDLEGDPHHAAFVWGNDQMTNLGNLGGTFAEAYGINDHNQIVGWSDLDNIPGSPSHAFLWESGRMTDLGTLNGDASEAIAINNDGLIVGQAWSDVTTTWRAVIWQDNQIIDLGTFRSDNGGDGICIDCNEAGDVVGYVARDHFYYRGFLYHNGEMIPLPEQSDWRESTAWSINDHRQIVGSVSTDESPAEATGCVWEWNHQPRVLDDLIPSRSNWHLGVAIHNNDAGQITGTGYRLNDPDHTKGYLLTPVHPTMELSEAVPGRAGEANTLTITGATPGARVVFVYGRRGGGAAIPGCTLQTNCLQIENPKVIGHAFADADGNASITANVPLIARGQGVLFQACVQDECAVSQLVAQEFE